MIRIILGALAAALLATSTLKINANSTTSITWQTTASAGNIIIFKCIGY